LKFHVYVAVPLGVPVYVTVTLLFTQVVDGFIVKVLTGVGYSLTLTVSVAEHAPKVAVTTYTVSMTVPRGLTGIMMVGLAAVALLSPNVGVQL
jgi:hypothetical protein